MNKAEQNKMISELCNASFDMQKNLEELKEILGHISDEQIDRLIQFEKEQQERYINLLTELQDDKE